MITRELVDYIKAQRGAGKSDAIIRQTLLDGGGWEHGDIDEAIAIAGPNPAFIPKPPQPSASAAPAQTSPAPSAPPAFVASAASNPAPSVASASTPLTAQAQVPGNQWHGMVGQFMPQQNSAASEQISSVPRSVVMPTASQVQAPVQAQSHAFAAAPRAQASALSQKSHKGILISIVVLLILVGGGGYAYVAGYFDAKVSQDFSATGSVLPIETPTIPAENMASSQEDPATVEAIESELQDIQIDDVSVDDL